MAANANPPVDRRIGGLVALAVLAFAVRLAAVAAIGSYRLEHVTYEHGEIARNLVEGRGFTVRWMGAEGPTSQQAPIYPALVALFYACFGVETPLALLALQVLQCLLGGIAAACTALLAIQLLPDRALAGWLTGLGTAVYPTLVYSATQVQVASLASMLVVVVLLTAARTGRPGSWRSVIACGVTSGILVLTDPILSLVVVVAMLMLAYGQARETEFARMRLPPQGVSLLRAVLVWFVCGAMVGPWMVRNYLVHGELVFVKSTFGYAFWQGNHPRSFGTDKIPLPRSTAARETRSWGLRALERSLWRTRMIDTLYIDDAVLRNERIAELGRFSEPQRSRQLMAEVTAYIRNHPWHYVRLCLQRLRFFLLFDETNPKSQVGLYRASHLGLQFGAVAGLWLSRRHWRRLWPTYFVFGLITAFHALTIASARFHIPLEPIQILWAGFALAEVSGRLAAAASFVHRPRPQVLDAAAT